MPSAEIRYLIDDKQKLVLPLNCHRTLARAIS
jgi:hypothetical protein